MAPMIDMVFLLLVFFMTVSTLAKEARPETELPTSTVARVPPEAPPRDILTVLPAEAGYRIFWYNKEVDRENLEELLEASDQAEAGAELLLRAPPELPWEAWEEILEALRSAGISDILFATFES